MNYNLVKKLGAGGFGEVHLATQLETGAQVAVKFLSAKDSDAYRRFCREAQLYWLHTNDRHVVKLLECNLQGQRPFIVLEYAPHGSLRDWLGKRALSSALMLTPWRRISLMVLQAADGLRAVHRLGGFHRDVKPENLLMFEDGSGDFLIKVSDFGLAREPVAGGSFMTQSAAGTPGYIAPEVLAGAYFTSAADIYSLGITFVELLTGSRDPRALGRAKTPDTVRRLVGAMLITDPVARPTADQVVECLTRLLAKESEEQLKQAAKAPEQPSPWGAVVAAALVVGVGFALLKGGG